MAAHKNAKSRHLLPSKAMGVPRLLPFLPRAQHKRMVAMVGSVPTLGGSLPYCWSYHTACALQSLLLAQKSTFRVIVARLNCTSGLSHATPTAQLVRWPIQGAYAHASKCTGGFSHGNRTTAAKAAGASRTCSAHTQVQVQWGSSPLTLLLRCVLWGSCLAQCPPWLLCMVRCLLSARALY